MNSNGIKEQPRAFTFLDKSSLEAALTCNICNRYLNVPPIVFSEDIGNICGRCNTGSSLNNLGAISRQKAFEKLVKNLTFPCTNSDYGCLEVLRYSEVQEHERSCSFKRVSCPLFYHQLFSEERCSWTGSSKMLCDHLRTHEDKFLDPPQFEWSTILENKIFFTTLGNQIITVVIILEKASKYVCAVMINGSDLESQCFRYQLEMADEEKNNSLILRRNRLEPISELLDNVHCPEKTLEIDINKIYEMLQNPTKILARFGIVKKSKKEIMQITGNKNSDVLSGGNSIAVTNKPKIIPPDEEMLIELECPICNEYMIPPIYICETGHSVCSNCKTKVQSCPTCRCPYANGRNFTLEKLTQKVKYPCRNREIGCSYVTTSEKIKHHQDNCELGEKSCVLNCGWKGFTADLYEHFCAMHNNCLMQMNAATLMEVKPFKQTYSSFLYVAGQLFWFMFNIPRKSHIQLKMMHVGHHGTEPQYKYSVEFTKMPDISCPNFSVTNFCQSHIEGGTATVNRVEGLVTIPQAALEPYMCQNRSWTDDMCAIRYWHSIFVLFSLLIFGHINRGNFHERLRVDDIFVCE